MMQVDQLVKTLNALGVGIRVDGTELVVSPKSLLTPDLMEELRQSKGELMALLSRLCVCKPPMPPADVAGPECQRCHLSGWCQTCGGCRWCAFQLKWRDRLEREYQG